MAPALAAGGSAAAGGGPVLVAGVPMQDMIESIRATVEIASRQGIAQARIALKPADLGEISVHLSQSSDGLIARVTADSAAGAQALAGGRSELHQSLSSLGVSLLRLDIGSSGQSRAGDREEGSGEEAGTPRAARDSEDDGDEAIGALDARTSTIPPADGALVDVLA